jgi:uncharacterized membrane protein YhaH (DUF805 family)
LIDKPFTFSGRASRSEFWLFYLCFIILSNAVLSITVNPDVVDPESLEYPNIVLRSLVVRLIGFLFLFITFLSVAVRRLHDVGRSAWWLLIGFSAIGVILLIYWSCKKGTSGPNRFGEDPLRGDDHAPITAQISE